MRIEERHDFDDYASVMWPRLVRAALLLGCSPPDAQDLVQTVLTRCLLKWRRVGSADDRDAYVHRMLVNTHISNRWLDHRNAVYTRATHARAHR